MMETAWAGLRLAVGTLTMIPVGSLPPTTRRIGAWAMALAPIAALPLGLLVAAVGRLGQAAAMPTSITATLSVGALALATRAMHLDGLADTADGIGAGWDRERALRNTAFLVANAIERHRASERTETAGQELLSSITEVERNVIEASNVAADAQRLTEEASKIVASLNTSSVEIGNVVKVITSIAEQTNLLALNATIEAARAGDAGKGFAVVANEVKDLARETAKATEEVDSKVSAIQSDAGSVVHALEGVVQTVNRINEAQNIISGVLTEQSAVTRSVLGA